MTDQLIAAGKALPNHSRTRVTTLFRSFFICDYAEYLRGRVEIYDAIISAWRTVPLKTNAADLADSESHREIINGRYLTARQQRKNKTAGNFARFAKTAARSASLQTR